MYKRIIEHASNEEIKCMLEMFMERLKERDMEMYDIAEEMMYEKVYGCHFTNWLLDMVCNLMVNEDGTTGKHWSLEETTQLAKTHGLKFVDFNEYDFNYVMNMMYSDYYSILGNEIDKYYKMSVKFLEDVDAPKGKAYRYHKAMLVN